MLKGVEWVRPFSPLFFTQEDWRNGPKLFPVYCMTFEVNFEYFDCKTDNVA